MCKDCGCENVHRHTLEDGTEVVHSHHSHHHHDHGHDHDHDHDHDHHHHHDSRPLTVAIEENILSANDRAAAANRAYLRENNIVAINFISSPGSGKTALLEATLDRLNGVIPAAVIVGDQRSDNDARRLQGRGAPVIQIETGDSCHLNAEQVAKVFPQVIRPGLRLLFIENVGNLVCPASFDLGERHKVAVLSVTEGEDKPLKYPHMFAAASLMLLNKVDLLPYLNFDVEKCLAAAREVNPDIEILLVSATHGQGMDAWLNWLEAERCA